MKSNSVKISLLITVIIILSNFSNAQIVFNRLYGSDDSGEEAHSIIKTFDGGYVFSGHTTTYGSSITNVWLVKLDAFGDTVWTKIYGYDRREEAYEVIQLSDSGFALIGKSTTASGGLYDDYWLLRTDQFGDTLWTKFYGDLWEQETPTSIIQTSDNGFAMVGFDKDYVQNGSIWLVKTDINGDTLWTKKYGGLSTESASCILQTSDGGYLIGGTINYYNNHQLYLIKTDAAGDTLWTKMIGGSYGENANALLEIPGEGYYVAGTIGHYTPGFNNDVWFLKVSSTGDSLWSKYYGNGGNEYATSMHHTLDGNYIIGGAIPSGDVNTDGLYLIKINSNGDTLWTERYGGDGNDWGTDAITTSDSGYILCGYTDSFGALSRDAWIIKTDSNGVLNSLDPSKPNVLNKFELHQNYPNPFNPVTKIDYTLPRPARVTLTIFDCLGQDIQTFVNGFQSAGNHSIIFNGINFSSGVYYYKLKTENGNVETKKMIFMK